MVAFTTPEECRNERDTDEEVVGFSTVKERRLLPITSRLEQRQHVLFVPLGRRVHWGVLDPVGPNAGGVVLAGAPVEPERGGRDDVDVVRESGDEVGDVKDLAKGAAA